MIDNHSNHFPETGIIRNLTLALALLGLASCAFRPEPIIRYRTESPEDTLILQYRDGEGSLANDGYESLARYGKVEDSIPKVQKRPSTRRLPVHSSFP